MIILNGQKVEFEQFPNGETKLVKDSLFKDTKISTYAYISFKYESDNDLIKLMLVKRYLDEVKIMFRTSLTIYYMPYSRMDRVENDSAFTLKYVAEFINNLNFERVTIIEPHSDVAVALLNKATAKYINFDLLPKVLDDMGFDKEKDYIVFPDAGAQKRYHSLTGYKQLVGFKNRDFETGEIKSLQIVGQLPSSTEGVKALIVDDLSSYGGTFVHTSKALNSLGIDTVNLLVAHAENSIFKGKLFDYIDKVYTTDSILTEQNNWENAKFKPQLKIFNIQGEL